MFEYDERKGSCGLGTIYNVKCRTVSAERFDDSLVTSQSYVYVRWQVNGRKKLLICHSSCPAVQLGLVNRARATSGQPRLIPFGFG